MHEAPSLVARTIMWALIITVATELIPVTAVLMGASDIKGLLAAGSPFSFFVLQTGGRLLNIVLSLTIATAIVNAVLATVMMNGRFFFSTGRDATWHWRINDAFTLTHSRFNSPWVATLASGASSVVMCFLGIQLLLVLTGTGLVFTYAGVCLGVLAGRRKGTTAHAAYRMPLYPFIPLFGLLSLAFIVYASWLDPDVGRPSLIANVAVIAVAVLYYRYVLVRRGAWVLRGPDDALPVPGDVP
jgi:amino acid transporter